MNGALRTVACLMVGLVLLQVAYSDAYRTRKYSQKKPVLHFAKGVESSSEETEIEKESESMEKSKSYEASKIEKASKTEEGGESKEPSESEDSSESEETSTDEETDASTDKETDGGEDMDPCTEDRLVEMWQLTFKYFDLNKDRVINQEDLAIETNIYAQSQNLEGCEENKLKEQLYKFFNCLKYDELKKGITMEKFVQQVTTSYGQNKAQTIKHIRECVDFIVGALDHDRNGFMSMNELSVFYKGVNMGNKKLTKARYEMMCPDTQVCCPMKNASDHWTSLLIGEDEETLQAVKDVYEDSGMSWDELVE